MSLKTHFLHSHLEFSPENCGAVNGEHRERCHEDICSMEKKCQGKWNCAMLADYFCIWQGNTWNTNDRQKEKGKKYMILFVLHNELT